LIVKSEGRVAREEDGGGISTWDRGGREIREKSGAWERATHALRDGGK
jgi:hypothetical protein